MIKRRSKLCKVATVLIVFLRLGCALDGARELSSHELQDFRKAFLASMGLSREPRPSRGTRSVPDYLWQIYSDINSAKGQRTRNRLVNMDTTAVNYFPTNITKLDSRTLTVVFDASENFQSHLSIRNGSRIARAQINIQTGDLAKVVDRLSLYEVLDTSKNINRLLDSKILTFGRRGYFEDNFSTPTAGVISSSPNGTDFTNLTNIVTGRAEDLQSTADIPRKNKARNFGWIGLDATEALQRTHAHKCLTFHLTFDFTSQVSDISLPDIQSGERKMNSAFREDGVSLVVYYNDVVRSEQSNRSKRTTQGNGRTNEKSFEESEERFGRRRRRGRNRHRIASDNHRFCKRRQVYVDFNELNWQDWILAPNGYEAYFCEGLCTFPLTSHQNSTNHAVVQSLINSVSPSVAPAPCCIPTETEQLTILYIDVENRIVVKNYPNMRIVACGCR